MKSVDHSSRPTANSRGGGENLSPRGTVHRPTSSEVNLTRPDRIESLRHKTEWPASTTCNICNLNRHSAPDHTIGGFERFDRLRKKLMPAIFPIEDIAYYCGKQFLLDQLE